MFDPELEHDDDDGGIEKNEEDIEPTEETTPPLPKQAKSKVTKPRSEAQKAAFEKMVERRKALLEEKRNKAKQPKPEVKVMAKRRPAKYNNETSDSSSDDDPPPKSRGRNKKSVIYNYYYGASPMMMPNQIQPTPQPVEQSKPVKESKQEVKPEPPKEAKNVTKKIFFA